MQPKGTPINSLIVLASSVHKVYDIASVVLEDRKFAVCSASDEPHQHHYGMHGLVQHTLEVAELAQTINDYFEQPVDNATLFLACLFHDYGKCWDYECTPDDPNQNWHGTEHQRHIHHVSRSAIEWSQAVREHLRHSDIEFEVLHAILSHHGRREFGSPVYPATKLAWLLHLSDTLSARMDDVDKFDPILNIKK